MRLPLVVRMKELLSACLERGLMDLVYSRVGTPVESPDVHQPEISMDIHSGNFLRLAIGIVGERHIWYISAHWTRCGDGGKQSFQHNEDAGIFNSR